jgi:envelope integrity protein B
MRVRIALQVAAASLMVGTCLVAAGAAEAGVALAPHRAVYDLKLLKSHGKRSVEAVRGRILYDFTGSACEGYALQFRQVSEIDSGEGKMALSDLRAATWEDGDAKSFRFNSENKVNERVVDSVDGSADRDSSGVSVRLSKPASKNFDLDAQTVFPTEHVRRVIEAAEAGKKLLELSVYDGSESGDKVFSTLAVIGNVIAPGEKLPDDAAAGNATLAALKRWPVTISYFEQGTANKTGEQTPAYSIGFELYENGISRALSLDYGDFVVSGTMSQLELKDAGACK